MSLRCVTRSSRAQHITPSLSSTELARQLKAAGRLEEAADCYRRATTERPNSAVAEHNLAALLGDMDDHAGAADACRRAFAKGGDAAETWLVYARALQGAGALDEAEAAYAAATARRADYAPAHRDLAQLRWMRTGSAALALRAIDEALAAGAGPPLVAVKATVLLAAGEEASSGRLLESAVAAAPGDLTLRLMAANAQARAGDAPRQLAHATAASQLDPTSLPAAKAMVDALLHAGRAAEAAALAERIAAAVPDDQGVIAQLATAWRLLNDPRAAALCDDPALVSVHSIAPPDGWPTVERFLDDLGDALRAQHRWHTHPLGQSIRHGSQTQQDLARSDVPVLRALFAALDAPIRAHIAALGPGSDPVRRRIGRGYRIAGAWSVQLRPGGFHTDHVHPEGWLSSAFYVALPGAVTRRPEGWLALGRPGIPTRPALGATRHVAPHPGQLVLFPSYLWHGTEPFTGDAPRLTVAFDVLPT